MNKIPRSFIDDLLGRIDIVEVIEEHVTLKKAGNNHVARCPFHQEKSPSFSVNRTKQFYYCFGCGVSGNALSFLMNYLHMSFRESLENLAHRAGILLPTTSTDNNTPSPSPLYDVMSRVNHFFQEQLRKENDAITYLKNRGLSGAIAKRFEIGFAPTGWDHLAREFRSHTNELIDTGMLVKNESGRIYDRFRHRIMFPIHDTRGRVIGFGGRVLTPDEQPKYLNSPQTPLFHKGQELYGLYQVLQDRKSLERIIIVEGYMDVVALAQHEINNAVATLGTATTGEHVKRLLRHCQQLVFCFDGDRAGHEAAWRALNSALPLLVDGVQIRFLFLPDGEDPDSYVRKEGRDAFLQQVQLALPLENYLFSRLLTNLNINTLDGKSRLVQLAKPLLQQIPDGTFAFMLIDQLSRYVRMEKERLHKMIYQQDGHVQPLARLARRQMPSNVKLAIALLLQNPELINCYQTTLLPQTESGIEELAALISLLQKNPALTTGMLLERWRDHDSFGLMSELASWQHHVPETGIEAEWLGALKRLEQNSAQLKVLELMAKAQQSGLSEAERAQLAALIKQKVE